MLKKQYLKSKPACKVTFELPLEAAPGAGEIRLLGDFNGWSWEDSIVMKKDSSGYKAIVELETGRSYEYRYLVDGESWINDWAADDYVPSPFHGINNSVIHLEAKAVSGLKKEVTKKPAVKKAAGKAAPAGGVKKSVSARPAKDDLKKIEGIGPKIEELLNKAGISTFQDLGKAKAAAVKKILEAAGPRYKMHDPESWSSQAKMAAQGDWEKLEKWQAELKGGKKK